MSTTELVPNRRLGPRTLVDVDIVIPVHNEEAQLRPSIERLRSHLASSFPFTSTITIADNASTDDTWAIAAELAAAHADVDAVRLDQKGRGRALRAAWSRSSAAVVAYMDVDLATDLHALVPLVAPVLSDHSDIAIGTRLARGSHVVRGARREVISRSYNLLLRSALRSSCTDAQCGFKAVRREVAAELLPLVDDDEWFFDTELLVTAQRLGLRIHEVPVHWVDDTDSRVEVLPTALADLRGVWRLFGATPGGGTAEPAPADDEVFADELLRFAGVGVLSTLIYVILFAAFRGVVGSFAANALAIVACSLGNTAVHRRLAGSARHRLGRWRGWATDAALVAVSLSFTTLALVVTRSAGLGSLVPELLALTVAHMTAAIVRFAVLRTWVFRPITEPRRAVGRHRPPSPALALVGGRVDEETGR